MDTTVICNSDCQDQLPDNTILDEHSKKINIISFNKVKFMLFSVCTDGDPTGSKVIGGCYGDSGVVNKILFKFTL